MNILLLDSIEPQTYGGMEEWIRLVAHGLSQRGHNVTVAGRPDSEFLNRIESTGGVATLPLDISGDFNPATITRLKSYLSEHDIDLITVNFNKDIRLGGIAARLDRRARVIWSVGLDITKDSLVHKLLTPRLVDGVIVPSASLKDQITRHGYIEPDIVRVIPIGIPDKPLAMGREEARVALRSKFTLPADSLIAVTSGRFVEQKGHRYLIEAAAEIVRHATSTRFLLLGDGPLRETLQQLLAASGLTDRFIFAGMLRDCDLELAGSDLMIHPSIEEPFGIVLLEAMRAGLPIVASDIGGIPEVVRAGKTALLVPPRDPDALTESAARLLCDPAFCTSLGRAGRARFEVLFTADRMLDHVEEYFLSQIKSAGCANGTA